jgi:hypothetical protein
MHILWIDFHGVYKSSLGLCSAAWWRKISIVPLHSPSAFVCSADDSSIDSHAYIHVVISLECTWGLKFNLRIVGVCSNLEPLYCSQMFNVRLYLLVLMSSFLF